MLTFPHQHAAHLPRYVGSDHHFARTDVGIVGRDVASARKIKDEAEGERDGGQNNEQEHARAAAIALHERRLAPRWSDGRRGGKLEDGISHSVVEEQVVFVAPRRAGCL